MEYLGLIMQILLMVLSCCHGMMFDISVAFFLTVEITTHAKYTYKMYMYKPGSVLERNIQFSQTPSDNMKKITNNKRNKRFQVSV